MGNDLESSLQLDVERVKAIEMVGKAEVLCEGVVDTKSIRGIKRPMESRSKCTMLRKDEVLWLMML